VWSIAALTGPPQLMIAAWKDGARRDMDAFFGDAMARAAAHLSSALAPITIVVPVPARSSSTRRRGVDLPAVLARAAASGLAIPGLAVPGRAVSGQAVSGQAVSGQAVSRRVAPVVACLRNTGGESRRLGARGRWASASAGIGASSAPAGEIALLVDDVVTTGASLARSCWALEREGVAVAAAVTLAATPPPGGPGTSVP
jgi:predicted amidophosphoribosyltransferase